MIFSSSFCSTYPQFVPEGVLANILGVTLIILAGFVLFVVTNSGYKRGNTQEEQVSLIHGQN